MEQRYWVTFVIVALVIGLVLGFGIASKASKIPELEKQIQQLTKENAELKAKLSGPVTPGFPGSLHRKYNSFANLPDRD